MQRVDLLQGESVVKALGIVDGVRVNEVRVYQRLLEFGDGQGDDVARLADGLGIGWRVAIRGDLSGRDRMAEIRRSG